MERFGIGLPGGHRNFLLRGHRALSRSRFDMLGALRRTPKILRVNSCLLSPLSNTKERRLFSVQPSSFSHTASLSGFAVKYGDRLSDVNWDHMRACGSYSHRSRNSSAMGGVVRSTVLHNWGEVIPISRSWWQIAVRTSINRSSSFDSVSITCAKMSRMSSVGIRRSGEVRKFLRLRRRIEWWGVDSMLTSTASESWPPWVDIIISICVCHYVS